MNVKQELRELGVKPVKGQNFLTSEPLVEALVESGEVDGKTVLEIGAGTGVITEKLSERAEKVYAVERDTVLAEHLRDKFSDSNVEVIEGDFLDIEVPEVDRCVSNLPFQITSDTVEILGKKQVQSSLILQKDLVDKMVSEPGGKQYGRFTVLANYYFIPVKLRDVGPENYYPKPDVQTSIVKLYPNVERHGIGDEDAFFKLVRALFTQKRKKVRNAFVDSRHIIGISKERAKEMRDDIPHSEERVINLDIRKLAEITEDVHHILE